MILYVDDNAGILFLKNVEITVVDDITDDLIKRKEFEGGSSYSYVDEIDFSKETDPKKSLRMREHEEILLMMKIFCKTCLN